MECAICKATSDEKKLFRGILNDKIVYICDFCAEEEKIPIIRKPTFEQLNRVEVIPSVRERMEKMSGYRNRNKASQEQLLVQGNLARLRVPQRKQYNPEVEDNYYWEINIARRRKKLSLVQVSELTSIPKDVIGSLEKGTLPENFREPLLKLESFFGIKLLKNHEQTIDFKQQRIDEQKKILEEVRQKMGMKKSKFKEVEEINSEDFIQAEEIEKFSPVVSPLNLKGPAKIEKLSPEKREKLNRIAHGEIDLSNRQNLQNVTLNDLVNMKRQKEKFEERRRARQNEEAMIGDEIDLDISDE